MMILMDEPQRKETDDDDHQGLTNLEIVLIDSLCLENYKEEDYLG